MIKATTSRRGAVPVTVWQPVICDGNSLTVGYSPLPYPQQLGAAIGVLHGYTLNEGITNYTTPQLSALFPGRIPPLLSTRRPNIYVAWEIGNDIRFNGADGPTAMANYWAWTALAIATPLIFQTVACTVPVRSDLAGNPAWEAARVYCNAEIRAAWAAHGCSALADIASAPELSDYSNLLFFVADGIHNTTLGQTVIKDYVRPALVLSP